MRAGEEMQATGKTEWRHGLFLCSPYPPLPASRENSKPEAEGGSLAGSSGANTCCPQGGGASVGSTQGGGWNSEPRGRMR